MTLTAKQFTFDITKPLKQLTEFWFYVPLDTIEVI